MTAADYARARRLLLRRDPILAALIRKHGPCGLAAAQRSDHFSALVRAIVGQQLSTKAASTIHKRLVDLVAGGLATPDSVACLTDAQLRAVGLSRQKSAYLRDLCAKVGDGTVRLDALERMSDDDVIVELTRVKGVGRWTAEMFLMFRLHRPDVLPVGDLGIRRAAERAYGLVDLPSADELRALAEPWRPHRTAASVLLWHSLDNAPE